MIIHEPSRLLSDFFIDEGQINFLKSCSISLFRSSGIPAVRCTFLLSSGFLDDEKPLAHALLFHMVDKAHPTLSPQDFRQSLERLGASVGASVGSEFSEISLNVTSDRLQEALKLVTPVFSQFTVRDDELRLQATLLERHLALALARPAQRVNYEIRAMKYGARFPGAAVPDPVGYHLFSSSDLEALWKTVYPTRLKAVCLVGDVPDDFSTEWLPPLPEVAFVRPVLSLEACEPLSPEVVLPLPDIRQVSLRWLRPLPLMQDAAERARLKLSTTLLGGFFGSRLMRLIREKEGLTYGIHAALSQHTGVQFLEIATEVDACRWQEAVQIVTKTLCGMASEPPAPEELHEVKNYMAGRLIAAFDGAFPQAERWLSRQKTGWTTAEEGQYIRALEQVTAEDVTRTAALWMTPEAFTLLRSEPA